MSSGPASIASSLQFDDSTSANFDLDFTHLDEAVGDGFPNAKFDLTSPGDLPETASGTSYQWDTANSSDSTSALSNMPLQSQSMTMSLCTQPQDSTLDVSAHLPFFRNYSDPAMATQAIPANREGRQQRRRPRQHPHRSTAVDVECSAPSAAGSPSSSASPAFSLLSSSTHQSQLSSHSQQLSHLNSSHLHSRQPTGSTGFAREDDQLSPQHEENQPLLHVATRARSQSVIRVLLRRGACSIDERDVQGRTALHVAAEMGDEGLVNLLLSKGACPTLRDGRGFDVLYVAVQKGHSEVVEVLLDWMGTRDS